MLKRLVLIFFLFVLPVNVLAENSNLDLKQENINPGNTLFTLKRLTEKIHEKVLFSQEKKVTLYERLTVKRLSELNYLVQNKNLTPIEQASQRLSAQAGVFVDGLANLEDSERNQKTLESFSIYKVKLGELRDNYPANSSYWLLLQQNIDTFEILSQKIK